MRGRSYIPELRAADSGIGGLMQNMENDPSLRPVLARMYSATQYMNRALEEVYTLQCQPDELSRAASFAMLASLRR